MTPDNLRADFFGKVAVYVDLNGLGVLMQIYDQAIDAERARVERAVRAIEELDGDPPPELMTQLRVNPIEALRIAVCLTKQEVLHALYPDKDVPVRHG